MDVKALKSKLVAKGMNVEDLAKKIGLDRSSLYRKLAGQQKMTIKDAQNIKAALNLTSNEARDIFFG